MMSLSRGKPSRLHVKCAFEETVERWGTQPAITETKLASEPFPLPPSLPLTQSHSITFLYLQFHANTYPSLFFFKKALNFDCVMM
ncbi:hypothetical protein RIF29_42271 [Crotalaria pallida]|uniref:Uncharacterized protein n=1 Tax=Crotalaria pallida TaxID=3830 RepID=A0AAN9E9I7_CROPI